jgi:hypothetical protein
MENSKLILSLLQKFAQSVTDKMSQLIHGDPEDQLRGPFEDFMTGFSSIIGPKVTCTGETPLPDHLGKPDFAVHPDKLLTGYVELKAPGVGANSRQFKGRNRDQFKRFSAVASYCQSPDHYL